MSEIAKKGNVDFLKFFREIKAELKKVAWPTMKQLTKHTSIVISAIFIVAVFIGAVDFIFNNLLRFISGMK